MIEVNDLFFIFKIFIDPPLLPALVVSARKKNVQSPPREAFAANQQAAAGAGQWEARIQANFTGWTNQRRDGI